MMPRKFFHIKYVTFISIAVILMIGAFFRFYRIHEYMTFLGDEGRDVLVVKRMLIDHKLTLLGPVTSVGSMYMGPVYYYLMAPFLWLFKFDPVGPAIMVALFALLSIYLIYLVGNEFLGNPIVGLVASLLYAISPLPIIYGRSSWNPNVVPFFSLLIIYSILKIIIAKRNNYLVVASLSLGILLQLHYVTFMFFPILFFIFLVFKPKISLKYYIWAGIGFLLTYSPFIAFELRHQFVNTEGVWRFLWQQKKEDPLNFFSVWKTITDVSVRLFWRLIVIVSAEYTKLYLAAVFALIILFYRKVKEVKIRRSVSILLLWAGVGILSYGMYRGVIYDYYFGSLFAFPYLFTGLIIYFLWCMSDYGKSLAVILLSLLVIFNLSKSPLAYTPNNLLGNTREIARFVFDKADDKPYNFALIAGKNSDHAYRYFLELWGKSSVEIENPVNDPKRKTVTNQLIIVCEEKVCQPLGHPLWEIAGFGQAEIVAEWNVSTAKVFKLVPLKI